MIYLARPSADGKSDDQSNNVIRPSLGKEITVVDSFVTSLLAHGFNRMFCNCLNRRKELGVDYFMMLHADVRPELGFAEKMLDVMRKHEADLLSVVIPFRDYSGLTSTALSYDACDNQLPKRHPRRITLKEVQKLPETFSLQDCLELEPEAKVLLLNSGLLLVNLNFTHVRKLHFEIRDWIEEDAQIGELQARVFSEDWVFSLQAQTLGAKCYATTAVKVSHIGVAAFNNFEQWGAEHDSFKS